MQPHAERSHPRFLLRKLLHRFATLIIVAANLSLGICHVSADNLGKSPCRPNIILILADDLGWGDVGYNGNVDVRTPVLDAMARTAVRFDRFYAAACVCSPTRGSFLTGRHPNRYGVFSWGWSLRPEEITAAEALGLQGYLTGHFGKWHLGALGVHSATSPGAQGFDEWTSSPNFYENNPLFSRRGIVVRTQGESSAVTVDAALDFIGRAATADRPFLAVVWFGNPHTPHQALDELREPYHHLPLKMQHYWGEISGIDRAMGKLRDGLRKLDVADNTLVLFTSDNGAADPGSTGGLRGKKATLWEGGIRVPAIVEWPGKVKSSRVVAAPCGTVDILPTVLAIAGAKHPDSARPLDGENLLPYIEGARTQREKPLGFWTYPQGGKGMRSSELLVELEQSSPRDEELRRPTPDEQVAFDATYPVAERRGHAAWIEGRLKLHRIPQNTGAEAVYELYDIDADPNETTNIATRRPDDVKRLSAALEAWQSSVAQSLNGCDYHASTISK